MLVEARFKKELALNEDHTRLTHKLNDAYAARDNKEIKKYRKYIRKNQAAEKKLREPRLEPPKPGCVGSWLQLTSYLNVPSDSWNLNFWVRPGPVNPLLWFDVIVGMPVGTQKDLDDGEPLMRDTTILSVIHDVGGKLGSSEERIYSHQKYTGKYFARGDFCFDLWKKLEDDGSRIQRAIHDVTAHLAPADPPPAAGGEPPVPEAAGTKDSPQQKGKKGGRKRLSAKKIDRYRKVKTDWEGYRDSKTGDKEAFCGSYDDLATEELEKILRWCRLHSE